MKFLLWCCSFCSMMSCFVWRLWLWAGGWCRGSALTPTTSGPPWKASSPWHSITNCCSWQTLKPRHLSLHWDRLEKWSCSILQHIQYIELTHALFFRLPVSWWSCLSQRVEFLVCCSSTAVSCGCRPAESATTQLTLCFLVFLITLTLSLRLVFMDQCSGEIRGNL